jgi:2-C-methyl-D-erythritol 4-phosphate cytidylyltransferase
LDDNELILIHDAARPNVDSHLIDDIIKFSLINGNTIIGTRISDTIKKEKNSKVYETINREYLWAVQTPQVFRYKELKQSYIRNNKGNTHTDESSLLESAGFKVNLFEGPNTNIKLTTSNDLKLLKKLI